MTDESQDKGAGARRTGRMLLTASVVTAACLASTGLGRHGVGLWPKPAAADRSPAETVASIPQAGRQGAVVPSEYLFDPSAAQAPVPAQGDAANALERALVGADGRLLAPLPVPLVSAYAPMPDPADPSQTVDPAARLGLDLTGLREGLAAYRDGDIARGDAAAAQVRDPLVAAALEWSLLRTHPVAAGYRRIARFVEAHPDWPATDWLRKAAEDSIYAANPPSATVLAFFGARAPDTQLDRMALARALDDSGQTARAAELARRIWREDNLNVGLENALKKTFGAALTEADSRYRAARLLYKEQVSAALRAAALLGPDDQALVRLRAAAVNDVATDKMFADAPAAKKTDAGYIFARIDHLKQQKKIAEAAALMQTAPRDPASIVDGDAWWQMRRDLARKSLDAGDALGAYRIAAGHAAQANDLQIEAEFHAGWIALRYLGEPKVATPHFDKAMTLARTPISRARAAYWRGRAAEAASEDAKPFYEKAGVESATFYGQLANLRLGRSDVAMRLAHRPAEGEARSEGVRAIELLYAVGAKDLAVPLVYAGAKSIEARDQIAALAAVVAKDRDAKVSLTLGKLASQNGQPIDDLAFPTYGVPTFAPFVDSASLPIVYSIARQESAFDAKAVSHAGALGLMQMIESTARRTAQRVGVGFDVSRMTRDPIFNAQLGAAHLGDLLKEQRNSLILTFAAYNAGGRRVKEWIAAYGDPREQNVDPVDWIERIPISETRNYVQRVMENYTVYRARLGVETAKAAEPLRREARM